MTESQRTNLKSGCVGVVAVELGNNRRSEDGMPPMDRTYASLPQAQKAAEELGKNLKGIQQRVIIYSIRFWTNNKSMFRPGVNGLIDMSYWIKSGYTGSLGGYGHFNFGYYDPKNYKWWDANHAYPGMKVKPNTLDHFSRPLPGIYNMQVFSIATTVIR